jgi:Flp pilus assembly pilin Flp
MRSVIRKVRKFLRNEEGLETVEYAVMTALIVAAMIVAIGALSGAITGRFGQVEGTISGIQ